MNTTRIFLWTVLTCAALTTAHGADVTVTPLDRTSIKPALPPGSLILPLEVDMTAAQSFIRLGFGLDETIRFQSTQLLTPRLRTFQAQVLIRLVESYNAFDGKKVAAALSEFRGQVSAIEFGREGSPVLYIDLPYWTHQREEAVPDGKGVKISDKDNEKLIKRLNAVFSDALLADEFSVDGRRVRIWWD